MALIRNSAFFGISTIALAAASLVTVPALIHGIGALAWASLSAGMAVGAIAAIGVALSLINFGIDEYVNPRLRSAGERARAMKKKGLSINDAVTAVRTTPTNETR